MRALLILLALAASTALCGDRATFYKSYLEGRSDPFGEHSSEPYDFDTLKHQDRIVTTKLVKVSPQIHSGPASVVARPSLRVGDVVCPIETVARKPVEWPREEFGALFRDYASREYEDCMCAPRSVMALLLYDKAGSLKSAILFDESHDSIIVSDTGCGVREFRFSDGHAEKAGVPQLIKKMMAQAKIEYSFLQRK